MFPSCFTTDRSAWGISQKSRILSFLLAFLEPLPGFTHCGQGPFPLGSWGHLDFNWNSLPPSKLVPQGRAAQVNGLLVSSSIFIQSLSHALQDHLWKKKLKVMYNINRFSVTSSTKGIQYVNCQALPTQETSAELLLAEAYI